VEEARIDRLDVGRITYRGSVLAADVVDPGTGEVLFKCNDEISEEGVHLIFERKIAELKLVQLDEEGANAYIRNTMLIDKIETEEEAVSTSIDG
jgi:DNA-directed RNA polymerase subunit beta